MIAPRMMAVPIKRKSKARTRYSKKLIILSWFLTRGQPENRAGRKHAFPSLFYGNGGTKFPKNSWTAIVHDFVIDRGSGESGKPELRPRLDVYTATCP